MYRKPTKDSFLAFLKSTGFPISTVVDVGVQHQTKELIEHFPDVHQILVEPVHEYHDAIRWRYENIPHTLVPKACGKEVSTQFLHKKSLHGDGEVTGSQIATSDYIDDTKVIQTEAVDVVTLNELCKDVPPGILLKIDVDGSEMDILQGATECLSKCVFVIVESRVRLMGEFLEFFARQNYNLFDVIDLCYIRYRLSQVDLVFVNKKYEPCHVDFHPAINWKHGDVFAEKGNYQQFAP